MAMLVLRFLWVLRDRQDHLWHRLACIAATTPSRWNNIWDGYFRLNCETFTGKHQLYEGPLKCKS